MVNNKNKTQQTQKFFLNKCLNVNSFSDYLQKMQPQFQWIVVSYTVRYNHDSTLQSLGNSPVKHLVFPLIHKTLTKTVFTWSNQVNCPKHDKLNKLPPSCCFIAPLNRSIYVLTRSCNSQLIVCTERWFELAPCQPLFFGRILCFPAS